MIGIYKITSPSGRIYIGQSVNIESRLRDYKTWIKCSIRQTRLHSSFKKYGADKHYFEVIEECSVNHLNKQERLWQEFYNVLGKGGLNCMYQHHTGTSGKMLEETKKKVSESKRGCKAWNKGMIIGDIYESKRRKNIIDLATGIFYKSITEASKYNSIKRTTLNAMLSGQSKNKTSLRYV
tara:strand:- start:194 stop:733 length:540 start_codon:yes stop_codon:yes gene_type:complete